MLPQSQNNEIGDDWQALLLTGCWQPDYSRPHLMADEIFGKLIGFVEFGASSSWLLYPFLDTITLGLFTQHRSFAGAVS